MKQRGRTSVSQLTVANQDVNATDRLMPPPDLAVEARAVWVQVVNSMPADWFMDRDKPILAQLCRHTVESQRVSQLIEQLCGSEEFDVKSYDKLLQMQERESRAIASLSTKLRLTPQSTRSDGKGKDVKGVKKPWTT